jgi:disulfide bond formation protein DsbB
MSTSEPFNIISTFYYLFNNLFYWEITSLFCPTYEVDYRLFRFLSTVMNLANSVLNIYIILSMRSKQTVEELKRVEQKITARKPFINIIFILIIIIFTASMFHQQYLDDF